MDKPKDKQVINVMTSSDEKLMPFIMTQIMSIVDNLPNDVTINYFLLYDTKENRDEKLKNIEILHKFSRNFSNVRFSDIDVGDTEIFRYIADCGGPWPATAYYSVFAHRFLPETIDRVLYLDAGDVCVIGDLRDYYFADISGDFILITPGRYKVVNEELMLYDRNDLYDPSLCDGITRGLFNSGSYVINLDQIRRSGLSEEYCVKLSDELKRLKNNITVKIHDHVYFGDQGFLSALFLGGIKYFGYPHIQNVFFMPFNFCMWYFDCIETQPWYTPLIIHFADAFKPWKIKYRCNIYLQSLTESKQVSDIKLGKREYYYAWHEYAIKSEIICRMSGILM